MTTLGLLSSKCPVIVNILSWGKVFPAEEKQNFTDNVFLPLVKEWVDDRTDYYSIFENQEKCEIEARNALDIACCWQYLLRYKDVEIKSSPALEESWDNIAMFASSFLHYEGSNNTAAIWGLTLMIGRAKKELKEAQGWDQT